VFTFLVMLAATCTSQVVDNDGLLNIAWDAPTPSYGDTLDHYDWELYVNDSLVTSGQASATTVSLINFYQLLHEGDKAVFKIRSIATQGNYSESVWAVSDEVVYDLGTGIQPPRGLRWLLD
jgi:hypothetical protein